MEQLALPDVLADGSYLLMELPMIPNLESEGILANGNALQGQQSLPGECEEFEVPVPEAPQEFFHRKRRTITITTLGLVICHTYEHLHCLTYPQ